GSVGQGMETALAQICAHELGVDYRQVRVIKGRTDQIDFGNGAHASRVTVMSGSATQIAARKIRAKALDVASVILAIPTDQLTIRDGQVIPKGSPPDVEGVSLAHIAQYLHPSQ